MSIRATERFRDQQDVLNRLRPRTTNLHISSRKTAGQRADLLSEFENEPLPLVVPRGMDFEEFAGTTVFRQVARFVAALSTQDERIADEFRAIQQGRRPTGNVVEIEGDVPVGMHMSLRQFADAISTRI